MIIVESPNGSFRLIALEEGWYFYSPPLENPGVEAFISIEDPMVVQISEMLGSPPENLLKSRLAANILLEKLLNLRTLPNERNLRMLYSTV
ncbi:MAG: hypothetical protein N2440_05085 [Actinobacteria bacterium]|nr:hypothetical protein [Actinomycetota bacterium]